MIVIGTPAQQRVSLQQTHCEEWVTFFTTQLSVRHLLSGRHALETNNLRLSKAGQHAWAVVINRQTTEIVAYELLNKTQQATIQLHQDKKDADLEEAIRLP